MRQGNVEMAFACFGTYCELGYLSGVSLDNLVEDSRNYIDSCEEYGTTSLIYTILPLHQAMLNLSGRSNDPTTLTGSAMNEAVFLQRPQSNFGLHAFYLAKTMLCCHYDEYEKANTALAEAKRIGKANVSFYEVSSQLFCDGLICVALVKRADTLQNRRRARVAVNAVRRAVTKQNRGMNTAHRLLLLVADYLAVTASSSADKELLVKHAYEKAIKQATRTGFRQDAALANLHAGEYFLTGQQDMYWASYYISRAIQLFDDWGAHGVTRHLSKKYAHVLQDQAISKLATTNQLDRQHFSFDSLKGMKGAPSSELFALRDPKSLTLSGDSDSTRTDNRINNYRFMKLFDEST